MAWAPRDRSSNVAVIFPPWTPRAEVASRVAASGAALIGEGRYPFVIIVRAQTKGFVDAALRNGAWFVLDARAAGGCLGRSDIS